MINWLLCEPSAFIFLLENHNPHFIHQTQIIKFPKYGSYKKMGTLSSITVIETNTSIQCIFNEMEEVFYNSTQCIISTAEYSRQQFTCYLQINVHQNK
jgi:hypothetical protein